MALSTNDLADLRYARNLLENVSLAGRIANAVGAPFERLFTALPQGAADAISAATNKALQTGLRFAVSTMGDRHRSSVEWMHKSMVVVSGAAGGAFGLPALAIELPLSTVVMLRSIADIARSEGELIKTPEAQLQCLEVFALGGRQRGDNAAETGYFAVRAALAKALAEAAEYIAERGLARETAPAVVRFITQVAVRFGIPVSEKVMAQSIPVAGAAGGAVINLLFIDHFQDVARGHFIVRRLERTCGPDIVKEAYLGLSPDGLAPGSAGGPASTRKAGRRQYHLRSHEPE
ncbi:MAG: EcsC family protein [Acidobacteria bacterium]|nr:EcsC family protein [Acidobacteriota bacterium]